jgi:hypothetical protein
MMKDKVQMALSIRQKRVQRISGDPVHGVAVQGAMDGPATCNQLDFRFVSQRCDAILKNYF